MYVAIYKESSNNTGVKLILDAKTDSDAKREVRKIVSDGYRNSASASVELSDGKCYVARNKHGRAVFSATA